MTGRKLLDRIKSYMLKSNHSDRQPLDRQGDGMTTTATIPNSDLVFRRDRDGRRALVFVHGFLDDQHVWAPVLAGLSAPGFETVQFDQAGFGDRTAATGPVTLDRFAADLSAVVDAIGKPFVLVGHSMAVPATQLGPASPPGAPARPGPLGAIPHAATRRTRSAPGACPP